MATYNKFQPIIADFFNGVVNLGSDQLTVALTDVAPTAANHVLADLTQVSYTNLSSRSITTTSSTQTSGTYNLKLTNLTLTALGTVAQFRYAVIYDSTISGGKLICWFDYGSEVNMNNGDTFALTFDGTNGLFSAS